MIKVQNVCLKYTKEFYALFEVSLNVEKGEKVAFLGENDSGKTTLIRALARLEKIDSGEIYIRDIPLRKLDFKNDVSVGYLPACPVFLENKSVFKNLQYVLKNRDMTKYEIEQKINESLIKENISKFRDEKVKSLSLFEKYVLSIVRLSFRELDLVLIDNIFDKVNKDEKKQLISLIKDYLIKQNSTVVLATTDEELAKELCSRTIKFKLGSIEK